MEWCSCSHFPEEPESEDTTGYGGMCNSWCLGLWVGPRTRSDVSLLMRIITGFITGSKATHTPIRHIQMSHGNHRAHESIKIQHLRAITRGQIPFENRSLDTSLAEKWELFLWGSLACVWEGNATGFCKAKPAKLPFKKSLRLFINGHCDNSGGHH